MSTRRQRRRAAPPTSFQAASPGCSALERSYEIIRELGRGETSVVYLAQDRAKNEEVAIKLIRPKYVGDEETMGRFAREARFLERLVHPNVVRVRAVLELGVGDIAIVMQYVPGRTLKELIRSEGRLAPARAERFTREIASALSAAHAMGVVHRDVKPENVIVDSDDHPLLADFGLARSMVSDSQLTMAGVAIGTPAYMAPEQIDGAGLDARGDIYSLGLLTWEMLSGRRPWEGESLYAVLYHQRYEHLPDVRELRDDIPELFADAIAVAIEKNPEMRWQNIEQMVAGLDGSAPRKPSPQRVPMSADTVRFTRPSPAVAPADGPLDSASALESIAAELEAQDSERISKRRRRYVIAGSVAAVVTLAAVAASMQRRAADLSRAPSVLPVGFVVSDSAGRSLPVTTPQPPEVRKSAVEPPSKPSFRKAKKPDSKPRPKAAAKQSKPSINAVAKPAAQIPAPEPNVAPVTGPSVSRVVVAAGGLHSCMINSEGRAYCWGGNDRGQLGAVGKNYEATPIPVAGDVRFTAVATGLAHSCAIARSGAAWCWGDNDRGQLGDRSNTAHKIPVPVADSRILTTVGVGIAHSCALDSEGEALCWGANAHGQLGSGRANNDIAAPTLVAGDHHYSSIALGWNFTCALDGGRAFCWGENSKGQLGDGSTVDRRAPVSVAGGLRFRSIATGASHACGVTPRGEAYCWGSNEGGQLGDGTRANHEVPTAVKTSLRFVAIAAGALHTCALTAEGQAFCWGRDNYGQLGNGGNAQDSAEPVRVVGNHSFAALRAFGSHTCGTTSAGEAFCWGYNLDGQLGDGSHVNRSRPVYVEPPPGT